MDVPRATCYMELQSAQCNSAIVHRWEVGDSERSRIAPPPRCQWMQVKALLSVEYKISKVCDVLLRASVAEDTGCFIAPHVDHGAEYVDVCAGRAGWSNVDPAGVCTGVWGYAAVVQGALCAPRYSQQLQSRPSSRTAEH